MDYVGQHRAELLVTISWILVAIVTTFIAWYNQSQRIAWYSVLLMTVATSLLLLPNWSFWRMNPVSWREKID